MTSIANCPKIEELDDLRALIEQFGTAWAATPLRPKPSQETIQAWSVLIEKWIDDASLPLFVRKHANNRGFVIQHTTGRKLVPTDNSVAQWVYTLAINNQCPNLEELRTMLNEDKIPMAMIHKSIEKEGAMYKCTLDNKFNLNASNWKLAHIESVGLNTRTALTEIDIKSITTQFRHLMQPSNMFVIPLVWSGLGEIESVIQAVADYNRVKT
jgi:hypothetical protein